MQEIILSIKKKNSKYYMKKSNILIDYSFKKHFEIFGLKYYKNYLIYSNIKIN